MQMRRILIGILGAAFVTITVLTIITLVRVFSIDNTVPASSWEDRNKHRLVLISQELDTPFWSRVEEGAFFAAEQLGATLEAWGTFGRNEADFLRNLEIAIASRVDGIIAQGVDADTFKKLTSVRAAEYGIPVITVGSDVPVSESLRKTYVGSNHYEAGQLLARQLIADMGEEGRVVLLASERHEHFERERLAGIMDIIGHYPGITSEVAETGSEGEDVARVVHDRLNAYPDAKAFISVAYNSAGVIVREIGKRFRAVDFYIYSFDENPDTVQLLQDGYIDGLIVQDPFRMGEWSVTLMMQWLKGEKLPLEMEGYFTDIRVLTREELP